MMQYTALFMFANGACDPRHLPAETIDEGAAGINRRVQELNFQQEELPYQVWLFGSCDENEFPEYARLFRITEIPRTFEMV
jgi:hypothetical protein